VKQLACTARLRDSCRDRGICRDKENPNVPTFTIDRDNHITALTSTPQAQVNPEAARFSGVKDLGRLAKRWPGPRLVEIWNALPGQKPVKKFTSRKVALSRIWAAARSLTAEPSPRGPCLVPAKAKLGKRATGARKPATASKRGKTGRVLELLRRPAGATLQQLVTATRWQAHSVRGFLSGVVKKKMGLKIESTKEAGEVRSYSIKA
jgi:Protein of unknown function (DUF3489)